MKLKNMFYFATKDRKLRYNDNRDIVVGETHEVSGKIELCFSGLHASKRILDALIFAPGPILYLVELSGKIVEDADKCAASKRKYITEFDTTEVLMKFARKQALINIELIKPYCSEDEYDLIVKYLETGDEEISEAVAEEAVAEADAAYWAVAEAAAWAAKAAEYEKSMSEANIMLTDMIREATGWDI